MKFRSRASQATPQRDRTAPWPTPVTLRLAGPADDPALERLAQLESRALPPGPHLVAVRERRIDAAISLDTGEVLADPFRHTAELCALLRRHAGPVRAGHERRAARRLRPSPTLAPT
jgi:hypothetical protein